MDELEYKKQLSILKKEHNKAVHDLDLKFITSNNIIKKGDIITDHIGPVKVDQIQVGQVMCNSIPVAVYHGVCMTKAGKPFKSGERRGVWAPNMKGIKQ